MPASGRATSHDEGDPFSRGRIGSRQYRLRHFFAQPPVSESTAPVDDAAARRGDEPWASNARHNAPARDITRKATLEARGQPWSSFCTEEGANRLVASLNHYYWRDERVTGKPCA
jgi:hypothetical protein